MTGDTVCLRAHTYAVRTAGADGLGAEVGPFATDAAAIRAYRDAPTRPTAVLADHDDGHVCPLESVRVTRVAQDARGESYRGKRRAVAA
jgi:hypothetical protein